MTPEEIAEIRQDSKTICPTNISAVSWQAHARELLEHIDSRAAEIKRLEDALVEERLSRNSKNRACLDEYGPEYDTEEFAREQLRAEGVIR